MNSIFLLGVPIVVLILHNIVQRLIKRRKFHEIIDKLPGPRESDFLGNSITGLNMSRELRWRCSMKYSKTFEEGIFRIWIGGYANVTITKAKHLDKILSNKDNITKPFYYGFMKPWLGNGVLTATGETWHRARRLIGPTLNSMNVDGYKRLMAEKSEILNQCIEAEVEEKRGQPIDVFPIVARATIDIICESIMGIKSNYQVDREKTDFNEILQSICKHFLNRYLKPWLHPDWLFHRTALGKEFQRSVHMAHEFCEQVIRERKLMRNNEREYGASEGSFGEPKRKNFLDRLLNELEDKQVGLSDQELREQLDTVMFAGHDTTTAAISFTLFCIGNEPEVQKKIQQELSTVFGDATKSVTFEDVGKLQYLERVIKESRRFFPSVALVGRSIEKEVEIGGYTLPPGCIVTVQVQVVHQDPDHWPDPEKFDPDRFSPEQSKGRHPYAYIPFSAGPRNCIGQRFAKMEEKIVLATVLRKWSVESLVKINDLQLYNDAILRPVGGLMMNFTKR